jgi:hypothetical protein
MVWFGGEQFHPVAQVIRLDESVEVAFDRGLIGWRRRWRSERNARAKKAHGRERDDSAH